MEVWRLVAKSSIIVTGVLQVPEDELKARQAEGKVAPVRLTVDVDLFLKGTANENPISLRQYVNFEPYNSPIDFLTELNGHKVLLFTNPTGLDDYALGAHSLRQYSPETSDIFRREIAEQRRILDAFPSKWPPERVSNYSEVKKLVDRLCRRSTASEAFKRLQILGLDAVPAMILMLNDNRPLALQHVAVPNRSPNAFEAIGHFRVEDVFHALTFLLGQCTGEGFGVGQSSAIDGWRIYLHHFESLKDSLRAEKVGDTAERAYAELY